MTRSLTRAGSGRGSPGAIVDIVDIVDIVEPDAGVAWVIARYSSFVMRLARRLAPEDSRFWPDLVQEGTIALWEAQHWRLDLDDASDERHLRRCVLLHMRRAHARMHRQAYPRVRGAQFTARR